MKNVFAERLVSVMGDKNPRKMAELTGLSHQAIHRYLAGERAPTGDAVASICRATGVSADYLLGLNSPADSPPGVIAENPYSPYMACKDCAEKDRTIGKLADSIDRLTTTLQHVTAPKK